jgi:hypothetical protein
MTASVKTSTPSAAPLQTAQPTLGENLVRWANRNSGNLAASVSKLVAFCVSNAKAAPTKPQDGMLRLARSPWWPVSGQTADAWVYYDAAGNTWQYLTTPPTNT